MCNIVFASLFVVIIVTRYGKVISTKAIIDPTVNKCKGIIYMFIFFSEELFIRLLRQ